MFLPLPDSEPLDAPAGRRLYPSKPGKKHYYADPLEGRLQNPTAVWIRDPDNVFLAFVPE